MALTQVLAPQLQQSLALLQAPTLELKALVEQELQQNPVLEEMLVEDMDMDEKGSRDKDDAPDSVDPAEPPADVQFDPATEKPSTDPVDDFQAEFEKLTQLDQEWRDVFSQANTPNRATPEDEERRQFMFDSLVSGTSLQEDLIQQLRQSDLPEDEQPIAEMLIGNIDDYGYVQGSIEELAVANNFPAEDVLEVLKVIQTFQPPGVGARDLRECLMLQLQRANRTETLEYKILDQHMDALGRDAPRSAPQKSRRLPAPIRPGAPESAAPSRSR